MSIWRSRGALSLRTKLKGLSLWAQEFATRVDTLKKRAAILQNEAGEKMRQMRACREQLEREMEPGPTRDELIAQIEQLDQLLTKLTAVGT
jgi:hypothetical protein